MTLADTKVLKLLKSRFVVGWRNIQGAETYAGKSGVYTPSSAAIETTNGAGSSNIQILVVDAEERVLVCLPGFWHPQDLVRELEFALELAALPQRTASAVERNDAFLLMHLNFAALNSPRTASRGKLQDFDEHVERRKREDSQFQREHAASELKSVDQVVHEKMAELPFVKLRDFDIGAFVEYGTKFYDKQVTGRERTSPQAGAAARGDGVPTGRP
ncbi:MAG: hypothetical protein ACKVX7_15010 [Planctomycetota bacterium]